MNTQSTELPHLPTIFRHSRLPFRKCTCKRCAENRTECRADSAENDCTSVIIFKAEIIGNITCQRTANLNGSSLSADRTAEKVGYTGKYKCQRCKSLWHFSPSFALSIIMLLPIDDFPPIRLYTKAVTIPATGKRYSTAERSS